MSNSAPWEIELVAQLADLDEQAVLDRVAERLSAGENPLAIIELCREGVRRVGERYERREYFLAGLIMAGEIFREVVDLARPRLEESLSGRAGGRVLLGTVQGDIHDLGKNIVLVLLRCHGFEVQDLGVDVSPEVFAREARAARPDVVGLSGLLTTSYEAMRETVEHLRTGLRAAEQPRAIVIGGGLVSEQVCRYVGADFWTVDAMEGVYICRRVLAGAPPGSRPGLEVAQDIG